MKCKIYFNTMLDVFAGCAVVVCKRARTIPLTKKLKPLLSNIFNDMIAVSFHQFSNEIARDILCEDIFFLKNYFLFY